MSEALRQPSESSVESASDSGEKKDTKEKKKKTGYLGLVAAEGSPEGIVSKPPDRPRTEWERLTSAKLDLPSLDDLLKGKEKDGTEKDKKVPHLRILDGGKGDDKTEQEAVQAEAEKQTAESDEELPLDELTPQEANEAVLEYTANSRNELAERAAAKAEKPKENTSEVIGQAEKTDAESDTEATEQAEDAAQVVLLESIDQEIAENPDRTPEEVLEAAEARTAAVIAAESTADQAAEKPGEPAEFIEEVEAAPEAAAATPPPGGAASASGAGGAGGPGRAGGGSGGPAGPAGPGGPGGPGGGGGYAGGLPPRGPGFGGAGFNVAPSAANVITQDITAERRAMTQGLLVGGILGYLIGKRRGRIKTEKRLLPIQKKLEKEVKALHETVAIKEQAIRKVAAEKAGALKSVEAKHQFAERLRQESEMRAAATAKIRQQAGERQSARAAAAAVENGPRVERYVAHAGGVHEKAAAGRAPAEVLRPLVVDAPAVILGGVAALRPERGTAAPRESLPNLQRRPTVKAENLRAERPVIDFTKQVETYSTEELKQAAEKIKVDDNTTLKELYDSGRLNENSVRRILREFVEGRSVRAAISNELLEKERKFERDPNLRNVQGSTGSTGSPTGGGSPRGSAGHSGGSVAGGDPLRTSMTGATAIAGVIGGSGEIGGKPGGDTGSTGQRGKQPVPDQVTLDRIRKQQMQQVAAATAATAAIIAVAIALLI